MTRRPYRNVPIRAALLNWLVSTAYDASDEIVARTEQYFPGFLTPGTIVAGFQDVRPMLYRAANPAECAQVKGRPCRTGRSGAPPAPVPVLSP
ncbi:hypothetical protein [Streptomyces sp. NPDC006333]|uniref:hypothetical protein n=1 Tax=Streptomyces sp. NPDC006333 TaxID=3156753 RepID=UPI0033A71578